MRRVLAAAVAAWLAAMLLPLWLLVPMQDETPETALQPSQTEPDTPETSAEPEPEQDALPEQSILSEPADTIDGGITLTVQHGDKTERMTLHDYLWGVVAAEMPAAFDQQALNAQAVAARTYTLYRMEHPAKGHPKADICTDSGCCQAWMSVAERRSGWSKKLRDTYEKKITEAVESTDGQALYWNGKPILAAFHAASADYTRSALEVWGKDLPYLAAVESPEGDEVENYRSTVKISAKKFRNILLKVYPKMDLSALDCKDWIGDTYCNQQGLSVSIVIGGVEVDTAVLRALFELRSPTMTLTAQKNTMTFSVIGYGHGVGMSQYGANALAKEGKTAKEILAWYYPSAEESHIGA